MAENTSIAWCDHSVNFWVGCEKVNEGCRNCYMFAGMKRWGGNPAQLRQTGADYWQRIFVLDRKAGERGVRERVFANSWSDFFAEEADEWRPDAWEVIRNTPNLLWLLLTKRPENIWERLPSDWGEGWGNVALGTSVHDQDSAKEFIPVILRVPARWRFVSAEPMLGHVDWRQWLFPYGCSCGWGDERGLNYCYSCGWRGFLADEYNDVCPHCAEEIDLDNTACPECENHSENGSSYGPNVSHLTWIIFGFESGAKARPGETKWIREGIRQCQEAGSAAPFVKQLGRVWANEHGAKNKKGEEPAEWPKELQVRELPEGWG